MAKKKRTDEAEEPQQGAETPEAAEGKAEGKAEGGGGKKKAATDGYRPRLRLRYQEEIVPKLKDELGLSNVMEVPRLEKIVLNMGLGEAVRDSRLLEVAMQDLETIAGQKPVATKARRSLASFKLRAGMPIGAKVTLRGDRMWEFCDRLLSVALPRIRDFRGLNPYAFDAQGNYTMGVTEQLIFPEIDYDKVERQLGMDITCTTTAKTPEEGYALLRELGFPFRERNPAAAGA